MSAILHAPPLQPKQPQEHQQQKTQSQVTLKAAPATSPPNKIKIDPKPLNQAQPKKVT
jgi:hypothetical protein